MATNGRGQKCRILIANIKDIFVSKVYSNILKRAFLLKTTQQFTEWSIL